MKFLIFVTCCLAISAIFLAVIYVAFCFHMNELNKKRCKNCGMYDKSLHTCWLKFQDMFPEDKGCDNYYKRDNKYSDDDSDT